MMISKVRVFCYCFDFLYLNVWEPQHSIKKNTEVGTRIFRYTFPSVGICCRTFQLYIIYTYLLDNLLPLDEFKMPNVTITIHRPYTDIK